MDDHCTHLRNTVICGKFWNFSPYVQKKKITKVSSRTRLIGRFSELSSARWPRCEWFFSFFGRASPSRTTLKSKSRLAEAFLSSGNRGLGQKKVCLMMAKKERLIIWSTLFGFRWWHSVHWGQCETPSRVRPPISLLSTPGSETFPSVYRRIVPWQPGKLGSQI